MKRQTLTAVQLALLERGSAAGGYQPYGSSWCTAYSLVKKGLGRIDDYRAGARLGNSGLFITLPTGREVLEREQAWAASRKIAREDMQQARALTAARKAGRKTSSEPDPVVHQAARVAMLPVSQLLSKCRKRPAVRARWAVMITLNERGHGLAFIGRRLLIDHTSVRYGLPRARDLAARDSAFAAMVEQVRAS